MKSKTIIINPRYNGPASSANGGYTAGLLANCLGGDAKVVLRSPPPLDTELEIIVNGSLATLSQQGAVIANAQKVKLDIDVPACPSPELIISSIDNHAAIKNRESINNLGTINDLKTEGEQLLPTCFVCGSDRPLNDGLGIFPVAVEGKDCVAAVWKPNANDNLTAQDGMIATEILWAALDCPGYFAHHRLNEMMLLGSMTASIRRRPRPNETLISVGWQTAQEGRKYFSGTALYDLAGEVYGASQQVWIALG